jgi:hypothetical protein
MMMRKFFLVSLIALGFKVTSQELFPNSEPASIIPKKAIGLRSMNEAYNNSGNLRIWNGMMFMYGISSKWMFTGMISSSNHHAKKLPLNFLMPDSEKGTVVNPKSGSTQYPYLAEAVSLGFRYRFVNVDGDHKHFRMAAYGNGIYSMRPHDEAEVTSMGDNKGLSCGLISTMLIEKLAVSLTTGMVKPFAYKEKESGMALEYENAYNYSLSFGYLVYPRRYKNFNQTNINLYAEFIGKSYGDLTIERKGQKYNSEKQALQAGNYLEIRPAIQFIVKSNLRIDVGTALPILGKSYIRKYPMYQLNLQYYFF